MTEEAHQTEPERPTKRIRLSSSEQDSQVDTQLQKELKAGITAYVSPNTQGFSGTLKQRYTDFQVNEILPDGQVLHLEGDDLSAADMAESTRNGTVENKSGGEKKSNDYGTSETRSEQSNAEHTSVVVSNVEEDAAETVENGDQSHKELSPEAITTLESIFGQDTTRAILALHGQVLKHPDRKRRFFNPVLSQPIPSKEDRTLAHQTIRQLFSARLDSTTSGTNTLRISAALAPNAHARARSAPDAGRTAAHGKLGWAQRGGEHLHFTLGKANKDTMEAVAFLAARLKVQPKAFRFAGTKDRRAVAVQRVSVFRVAAERLRALNAQLRGARVGGFAYEKCGLALGELRGNEFTIVLRDCGFPGGEGLRGEERVGNAKSVVASAVTSLQEKGFINYYGLQRFGSFSTGTDEIGKCLLKGDFKGAVDLILHQSPLALAAAQGKDNTALVSSDDRNRALALDRWQSTGNAQQALELMPRKYSAEIGLLRHLGVTKKGRSINANDYQGALLTIQRNLRLMYVHAYQSLVWNVVAGKRWELYGDRVVAGDLVIVEGKQDPEEEVDADGEIIVKPEGDDRAANDEDYERAQPLSADEAKSGKYSIFDVVLPLPGYDVVYPPNQVGTFYKEFMASERGGGLDPHAMRRKQKDYSLSGGYRKLMARPASGMTWEIKAYHDENEQLVDTDLIKAEDEKVTNPAESQRKSENGGDAERLAVILRMQLGASQYATMALRELMKDGVKSYQADFGAGRD